MARAFYTGIKLGVYFGGALIGLEAVLIGRKIVIAVLKGTKYNNAGNEVKKDETKKDDDSESNSKRYWDWADTDDGK